MQLEGFKVRQAQDYLDLHPHPFGDEVVPPRYVYLAAEAWGEGDLSEGQLARLLRTDRLGARRTIQRLEQQAGGTRGGEDLDLARPLLGASSA
jgi:hypothetical protein